MQTDGESKTCCGLAVSQTVSIRWFIVMIAFVGICCSVVGTVLGAMKAQGREHLTVSLLMIGENRFFLGPPGLLPVASETVKQNLHRKSKSIFNNKPMKDTISGVGIVLVTVSGIAWRLTSQVDHFFHGYHPLLRPSSHPFLLQDAPTCRAMLGLGGEERLMPGHNLSRGHPYAGMIYSEFQYRPPPPSYQASMQEYRLRLLLMERSGGPPPAPPPALSPPPAYRGPGRGLPLHGSVSRPPSYHSRQGSSILPLHARHPSQLSKLSIAGANDPVEEEEKQCPVHVTQVPVVPSSHKASIQIQGSQDMEQYISNIQEHFHKIEAGEKSKRERRESEVTIVQNTSMEIHQPVVVTVSGSLDVADSNSNADCDVLAHL